MAKYLVIVEYRTTVHAHSAEEAERKAEKKLELFDKRAIEIPEDWGFDAYDYAEWRDK